MYEPQEDSYFLKEIVKEHAFGKCLDMGCGTGIIGNEMLKNEKVKEVHFADINKEAIDFVKRTIKTNKQVKFFGSDLFKELKDEKYDFIAFNPPYLKGNYQDDPEIYAGKRGNEIILRFLNEAVNHLKDNGKIALLFSEESNPNEIKEKINQLLFEIEMKYKKSLFFEMHYVLIIKKSEIREEIERYYTNIKFFSKGWRSYVFMGKEKKTKKDHIIKVNKNNNEEEIKKEYEIMKKLQNLDFIPKVHHKGKAWFSLDYVKGISFNKIIEAYENKEIDEVKIERIIKKILRYCHQLDKIGIKKEEMNRPTKNILVDVENEKVWFIDFDKAKKGIGNVNEFMSYIMNHFPMLMKISKENMIKKLKDYKKTLNFNLVKDSLDLN